MVGGGGFRRGEEDTGGLGVSQGDRSSITGREVLGGRRLLMTASVLMMATGIIYMMMMMMYPVCYDTLWHHASPFCPK